jgi:hypothetical protein
VSCQPWTIRLVCTGLLGSNGLAYLPVAPLTKKVLKDFSNRKKTVWGKNIKLIKENCQEKKEMIICLFIPFCTMPQNVSTCNKLQRFFNISQTFWLNKGRSLAYLARIWLDNKFRYTLAYHLKL